MIPEKTRTQEQEKGAINGPRPTPLRIKKDPKETITKPSSSRSIHHPVIIYAHSPKVFHTEARDFRALVQSLTGLERATGSSSSITTTESEFGTGSSSSMTMDAISSSSRQYLAEMPLFTPNSTNLLFSPLPMCRYSDAVSFSPLPYMGGSISPSLFAVKREFPKI